MTEQRKASLLSRADKIAAHEKLIARLDLADRLAMQAMRVGCFDEKTARMVGAFEPWGFYVRDVKRSLDTPSGTAYDAMALTPPPVPEAVDTDLRFAVSHFAELGDVPLPTSWSI